MHEFFQETPQGDEPVFCTMFLVDICFCVSKAANAVDVVDCGIRGRQMSDQDLQLLG